MTNVSLSDSYSREADKAIQKQGEVDVIELRHSTAGGRPMVFEVTKDEKGYPECSVNLLEEISLFVTEGDDDWEITVTRKKIKRFDFDNLPEFPGW